MQSTTTTTTATTIPTPRKFYSGVTKYGYDTVFDTVYLIAIVDNALNTYFGV